MTKIHIVTEPSWICRKLADQLSGSLGDFRVRATTQPPRDAELTYYLPYLFREFYRPAGKSVALFTHYTPGDHQKRYDFIAKQVDHCVVLNKGHEEYLSDLVGEERVSRVHLPIKKFNSAFPFLRVGWFHRSPEGYDKRKRTDLLEHVKALPWVELVPTYGSLTQEELNSRMRSVDVFLTTSDQESGPVSLLEGLALGKQIVIPAGVGLADEYANIDGVHLFKPGDVASMEACLWDVYKPLRQRYAAVEFNTVERWREDHMRIFQEVLAT